MNAPADTPWLSVIVPVHDGARFLDATLASAAAQADAGMEFLCYDSGDDGGAARAIGARYADRLDIRWLATPEIKPWTAKTNLGVRQARAAHIVMLHQDDLWLPGHGRALRASVDAMDGAVLSIGPSRMVGAQGQDVGPWRLPFAPGRHDGRTLAARLIVQNTIAIPSPLIARAAFLAVGGMDEALWYTADWDLYLKLALAGDVWVRSAATTAFRLHAGSLTMTGSRDLVDFRGQHDAVLGRYLPACAGGDAGVAARARASAAANVALAGAARGDLRAVGGAAWRVLALGPWGGARFLRETRLVDRVSARLRLRLRLRRGGKI